MRLPRSLVGLLALALVSGFGGGLSAAALWSIPEVSAEEQNVWRDRAALLDPDAYELQQGANWSVTVPPGRVWYAVGLWRVVIDGESKAFHRDVDARNPLALPAGTRLSAGGEHAYAYIARPEAVDDDPRYRSPRDLYWNRLDRAARLPQRTTSLTIPPGQMRGYSESRAFPSGSRGLLTLVSSHDVAWTGLTYGQGTLNLNDEISDDHPIRFAKATMLPFNSGIFEGVKARVAAYDGFVKGPGLAGQVLVRYVDLPADW